MKKLLFIIFISSICNIAASAEENTVPMPDKQGNSTNILPGDVIIEGDPKAPAMRFPENVENKAGGHDHHMGEVTILVFFQGHYNRLFEQCVKTATWKKGGFVTDAFSISLLDLDLATGNTDAWNISYDKNNKAQVVEDHFPFANCQEFNEYVVFHGVLEGGDLKKVIAKTADIRAGALSQQLVRCNNGYTGEERKQCLLNVGREAETHIRTLMKIQKEGFSVTRNSVKEKITVDENYYVSQIGALGNILGIISMILSSEKPKGEAHPSDHQH